MTTDETAKHSPEDLLERLRIRIHDSPIPNEQLMDEAVEVIERLKSERDGAVTTMMGLSSGEELQTLMKLNNALQADNNRLRSLNDELQGLCVTHEICVERLQADNDRMRKALEKILNFSDLEMRDGDAARAIAEETLAFFAQQGNSNA